MELSGQFDWSGVPVIHKHPISATLQEGQTMQLSVIASSTSQINYQWQHQSPNSSLWNNIGTNSNQIDIPNCNAPNAGVYQVLITSNNNVYVCDSGNYLIRKIKPNGEVVTIGGSSGVYFVKDGIGTASALGMPTDINLDNATGILYVSDSTNHRIIMGIPLRSSNGGGGLTSTSQTSDSDNDGQPDLSEILSGTDPYDSGSALKIESASFGTVGANKTVTLSFPAVQGIIYQIEHSSDLQNWTVLEDHITPTNGVNVINKTLTLPPGTKGFVRVAVQEL